MLTASGEFLISDDVEMKAAADPPVPKAEDKELEEDAEMEDLFGNDDNLETKGEDDGINIPRWSLSTHIVCILI
jgi:hypothetical protein